jgi:DNA-binding CsgD family transcriptional regulator
MLHHYIYIVTLVVNLKFGGRMKKAMEKSIQCTRGRPRKFSQNTDTEMLVKMVDDGKTDKEIAVVMNISERTVVRYRLSAGKIRKRGGIRLGAGRKRKSDEMLRQQAIDCRVNSFEVGLGKKKISDEDWIRWTPDAFSYRMGIYVRRGDVPGTGVPACLPRGCVNPESIFADPVLTTQQAFDAAKGGSR